MISLQNHSAKLHANHRSLPHAIKFQEQEGNFKFYVSARARKCSLSIITYSRVNSPKEVLKII